MPGGGHRQQANQLGLLGDEDDLAPSAEMPARSSIGSGEAFGLNQE